MVPCYEKRHRRISRGWIFELEVKCQIFDLYAGICDKHKFKN